MRAWCDAVMCHGSFWSYSFKYLCYRLVYVRFAVSFRLNEQIERDVPLPVPEPRVKCVPQSLLQHTCAISSFIPFCHSLLILFSQCHRFIRYPLISSASHPSTTWCTVWSQVSQGCATSCVPAKPAARTAVGKSRKALPHARAKDGALTAQASIVRCVRPGGVLINHMRHDSPKPPAGLWSDFGHTLPFLWPHPSISPD